MVLKLLRSLSLIVPQRLSVVTSTLMIGNALLLLANDTDVTDVSLNCQVLSKLTYILIWSLLHFSISAFQPGCDPII